MARIRTVFGTHANLAHTWAQQTYEQGFSADRRMFFHGDTIYSYGRHYAMARFTELADTEGRRVVFFKADGYSVSTAKHRNHTHGALRGLNVAVVYVDDVNAGYTMNVRGLKRDFASAAEALTSPTRNRHVDLSSRLQELQNRADTVRDFAALYGETLEGFEAEVTALADRISAAMNAFHDPVKVAKRERDRAKRFLASARSIIHAELDALDNGLPIAHAGLEDAIAAWIAASLPFDTVQPLIARIQRNHAEFEIEQTAKALDPDASAVLWNRKYGHNRKPITPSQWQEGEGAASQYEWGYNAPTLVRRKGDRLETSRGAEVPFKHAVLAYLKAQHCRETGTTWQRNGEKVAVGVYQLDAIDAQGNIRAGCHTIAFDEMQRLAVREVPHLVRASFPVPALIAA